MDVDRLVGVQDVGVRGGQEWKRADVNRYGTGLNVQIRVQRSSLT